MAGIDAGEWVDCPSCGTSVLGKAMIPVLGDAGGVRYTCLACARAFIVGPGGPLAPAGDITAPADTVAPTDPVVPVPTGPTG